jgi:hypothetical protein
MLVPDKLPGVLAEITEGVRRNPSQARENSLDSRREFSTHGFAADPDIPILKQAKAEYANLQ